MISGERAVASDRHDALEQQFDAIKTDYERTTAVIDSLVRTRVAVRAFAVAAVTTLVGLGIQNTSRALTIAAAIVACSAWAQDAYLWWAYRTALRRANELERLYQSRLRALDRPYDPFLVRLLRAEIERHEFGVYATFPRASIGKVLRELTAVQSLVGGTVLVASVACAVVIH